MLRMDLFPSYQCHELSFSPENEGVEDTGGGAVCEQRVWPQAAQRG